MEPSNEGIDPQNQRLFDHFLQVQQQQQPQQQQQQQADGNGHGQVDADTPALEMDPQQQQQQQQQIVDGNDNGRLVANDQEVVDGRMGIVDVGRDGADANAALASGHHGNGTINLGRRIEDGPVQGIADGLNGDIAVGRDTVAAALDDQHHGNIDVVEELADTMANIEVGQGIAPQRPVRDRLTVEEMLAERPLPRITIRGDQIQYIPNTQRGWPSFHTYTLGTIISQCNDNSSRFPAIPFPFVWDMSMCREPDFPDRFENPQARLLFPPIKTTDRLVRDSDGNSSLPPHLQQYICYLQQQIRPQSTEEKDDTFLLHLKDILTFELLFQETLEERQILWGDRMSDWTADRFFGGGRKPAHMSRALLEFEFDYNAIQGLPEGYGVEFEYYLTAEDEEELNAREKAIFRNVDDTVRSARNPQKLWLDLPLTRNYCDMAAVLLAKYISEQDGIRNSLCQVLRDMLDSNRMIADTIRNSYFEGSAAHMKDRIGTLATHTYFNIIRQLRIDEVESMQISEMVNFGHDVAILEQSYETGENTEDFNEVVDTLTSDRDFLHTLFKTCAICWEDEVEYVNIPCGHVLYCSGCIPHPRTSCPLCRRQISKLQKWQHNTFHVFPILCHLCQDDIPATINVPCGHYSLCRDCATPRAMALLHGKCPYCRTNIEEVYDLYM